MSIWAASPVVLYFDPTLFGLVSPWVSPADFMRQVAKIWLVVGIGGLLFRTVHLFFIRDVETGLVWMTKILTDPFNDFKIYRKAPLALLRGELIDPGLDILEHGRIRRAARLNTLLELQSQLRHGRGLSRPSTSLAYGISWFETRGVASRRMQPRR